MTTSTSRLPEILTPPEVSIRPVQGTLMASAAILVISSLALGFILATKGSLPHVVSSFTGDALPLTALGGISFIIFTVSVVRFKFMMNEIEAHIKNVEEANEASNKNSQNERGSEESAPRMSISDFLELPAPELTKTQRDIEPLYDQTELAALAEDGWLKDTLSMPPTLEKQERDFTDWLKPLAVSGVKFEESDLFDNSLLLQDEAFQQELDSSRHIVTVLVNKLAVFMAKLIEVDYQVDGSSSLSHFKERLESWKTGIGYLRDNVVLDLINILQGKRKISSQLLLSYFLGFQGFYFPLAKAESVAVRRMIAATNFENFQQAEQSVEIRKTIRAFFASFHKSDDKDIKDDEELSKLTQLPEPAAIKKIEECLIFLTLSFFERPSPELRMEVTAFFHLLLSDNSELFEKDAEVLAIIKNYEPKKDHEFRLLAVLFLKAQNQHQIKGRFHHFFSVWVKHFIYDLKKKGIEFFKVLGNEILPIIDEIIRTDDFDKTTTSPGKVLAGMKAGLFALTFNCGILKSTENSGLARSLFEQEIDLNYLRKKEYVALLLEPAPEFAVSKAHEVVKDKVTHKFDPGVKPLVMKTSLGKLQEVKPYYFPFLPLARIAWWASFAQTKGAIWGIEKAIKSQLEVEWMVKPLKSIVCAIYDGMIAKRPENTSWYNAMTNTSKFRQVFTQITIPANAQLKQIILRRIEFDKMLSTFLGSDERVFDLIHEFANDDEDPQNPFLSLAKLMVEIGQHLTHIRKSFEKAIPK